MVCELKYVCHHIGICGKRKLFENSSIVALCTGKFDHILTITVLIAKQTVIKDREKLAKEITKTFDVIGRDLSYKKEPLRNFFYWLVIRTK